MLAIRAERRTGRPRVGRDVVDEHLALDEGVGVVVAGAAHAADDVDVVVGGRDRGRGSALRHRATSSHEPARSRYTWLLMSPRWRRISADDVHVVADRHPGGVVDAFGRSGPSLQVFVAVS